jgi:hypothetical protein
MTPSHRPHCNGHDYYERGIYLITIVVANRDHLFGELNMDIANPGVNLTPLGRAVLEIWENTPAFQQERGRNISVLAAVAMPDHFHGVLFVKERMDVSVGEVICGFKTACTQRWRALLKGSQPYTAENGDKDAPHAENGDKDDPTAERGDKDAPHAASPSLSQSQPHVAATTPTPTPDPHRMSRAQRAKYYASHPRNLRPLFDDNYDDSFLWRKGQLQAMIAYVHDNPRRAIIKARVPQFMKSCLCLTIGGVRYSAFGNFLLLRKPLKAQVFCHRMARMEQLTLEERLANGYTALPYAPGMRTKVRYIDTLAWQLDRDAWIKDAQEGTVLVTPGISPGELAIKNIAIENRLPLIHLQKEPITRKPEGERFYACAEGSLLILAPWPEDLDAMQRPSLIPLKGGGPNPGQTSLPPMQGDRGGLVSDYDRFHNMNLLAEQICAMDTVNFSFSFRIVSEG